MKILFDQGTPAVARAIQDVQVGRLIEALFDDASGSTKRQRKYHKRLRSRPA